MYMCHLTHTHQSMFAAMPFMTALMVLLLSNGCSGCGDGCAGCAGITQICSLCKHGYWLLNNNCKRCPDNCEQCVYQVSTFEVYCSKCKTNFWGTGTCDKQCPESCDGCEYKTGQCYRCLPGFYGTICQQNCTLCKDGLCDIIDGHCINGCIDGYFEDTANEVNACRKCSNNCALCKSQKICSECDKGFYKLRYENANNETVTVCYPCLPACEDCNTDSTCTVCKPGTYGYVCQYNCSDSHCYSCNKVDDVETCTECVYGYNLSSTFCVPEISCSPYCAYGCDETELCVGGCKDGWSGQTCTVPCASQCQTCNQNNNTVCTKCKGDYFMSSCNNRCNEQCSRHPLQETCRLQDGFCLNGCKDGYWGDTCNNSCNKECAKFLCSRTDGTCAVCRRNYYGEACEYICSENCVDDGSILQICSKSDGRCELGCNNGYSGDRCDETTSKEMTTFPTSVTQETSSRCSKQDTNDNETKFYLLGMLSGVGIALIAAAGIGVFIFLRCRQKFSSEINKDLESREQREYENTSFGMRLMHSVETDHTQPPSETSANVYERLQKETVDDQQQYSELGKPKDIV